MRFSAGMTTLVMMTGAGLLLSGDIDIEEAMFTLLYNRVHDGCLWSKLYCL